MKADWEKLAIRQQNDGLTFGLRVQPRAGRNKIVGIYDGALKIAISAAPVDEAANRECVRFLSGLFKVPSTNFSIIAGSHARTKIVRVIGLEADACRKLLCEAEANQ